MYLRGKGQYEISDVLGISQATVSRDLKAIQKLWLKSSLIDFNEARAREIAKIDHLECVYWEAWEASKVSTTIRGSDSDATVTQKEGAGNQAFTNGVKDCIKLRADLLGLMAAQVVAVVGEDFDQEAWTNERSRRHAAALAVLEDPDDGETQ